MSIPTISYLNEQGELSSDYREKIPDEIVLKAYRTMLLTRLVDERMITLQRQGTISFALSCLGEESCAVASAAALSSDDWLYPQYRESGIMFWRGCPALEYIHHMFGDRKDLILGRQMPNHFGSRRLNVVQVSSPIGTKIPHAAGCGYAMRLQRENKVAVCYFGEGATSEGDFSVGLNFAAVRKSHTIFFCRNNGYAISTPAWRQFATDGVAPKGIGLGVPSYRVDGNDFFAVYEVVKQAREHCVAGKGPVLIEAMTYRLGAHSTSDDPTQYRQQDEVDTWSKKDPVVRLRLYLENNKLWDAAQEEALRQTITKEIDEAIAIAKETPKPPLDSLVEHVYFDVPDTLKEQLATVQQFFKDE